MAKIVDLKNFIVVQRYSDAIAITNGDLEPIPGCKGRKTRVRWTWLSKEQYELHDDGTISVPLEVLREKGLAR